MASVSSRKSFRRLFDWQECVIFWMRHKPDERSEFFAASDEILYCGS